MACTQSTVSLFDPLFREIVEGHCGFAVSGEGTTLRQSGQHKAFCPNTHCHFVYTSAGFVKLRSFGQTSVGIDEV